MKWTPAKLREAAAMKRDGCTYGDIAAHYRVSRSSVLGIANRNRDLFPKEDESERAARYEQLRGGESAPAAPAGSRFQWTDALRTDAARLYAEGQNARQISEAMGCCYSSATKMIAANPDLFPKKKRVVETKPAKAVKPSARMAGLALPGRPDGSAAKPHAVEVDLSQFAIAGVTPKTILTVGRGECRFPLSPADAAGGPDMPVCGAPVRAGASWCPTHCRDVFVERATENSGE